MINEQDGPQSRAKFRIRDAAAGAFLFAALFSVAVPMHAQDTAALYKTKCAACHGPDGKGDTPTGKAMKVRSFAGPEVAKMSDDEVASVIEKGKGKMPSYGKSMKPDEIKAMVAYIRSLAK
jgi:mono/diheme cytochrome c family protein